MDLLKNSGSFGSNTYKFRLFKNPKYEFVLVGPVLNKSDSLKIYKKLLLIKCKKVSFVNDDVKIELPGVMEDDLVDDSVNNDKDIDNEENENIDNIDVLNEDGVNINNSDNILEDNGRSR